MYYFCILNEGAYTYLWVFLTPCFNPTFRYYNF